MGIDEARQNNLITRPMHRNAGIFRNEIARRTNGENNAVLMQHGAILYHIDFVTVFHATDDPAGFV
jgi:hypothetical protein